MLNGENVFTTLYNFFYNLIDVCKKIWEWMNADVEINLSVIGINEEFKPLYAVGTIVVAFIVAKIIKDFVPLA